MMGRALIECMKAARKSKNDLRRGGSLAALSVADRCWSPLVAAVSGRGGSTL